MEDQPTSDDRRAGGEEHLKKGLSLKSQGQFDLALTEFRRAILRDPQLMAAHLEAGRLYKEKAKFDPMFQRFAFEAFQKAARLGLTNQDAHDQYIMAAQISKRLDELKEEYDLLVKNNPDNELMKRCQKNVVSLVLAYIPDKISIDDAGISQKISRVILVLSLGGFILGLVLMLTPLLMARNAPKDKAKSAKGMITVGIMLELASAAGFVARNFIK